MAPIVGKIKQKWCVLNYVCQLRKIAWLWSYLRCIDKPCNTCHSNRPPSPHLAGDQETTSETIVLLPAHVKVLKDSQQRRLSYRLWVENQANFQEQDSRRYLRLFFIKPLINISGGPHGTNDDYFNSLQSQPQGYHQNYSGNGRQCPAAAGNKNCDQFYTTSNISNHQSCCPFYSELV